MQTWRLTQKDDHIPNVLRLMCNMCLHKPYLCPKVKCSPETPDIKAVCNKHPGSSRELGTGQTPDHARTLLRSCSLCRRSNMSHEPTSMSGCESERLVHSAAELGTVKLLSQSEPFGLVPSQRQSSRLQAPAHNRPA